MQFNSNTLQMMNLTLREGKSLARAQDQSGRKVKDQGPKLMGSVGKCSPLLSYLHSAHHLELRDLLMKWTHHPMGLAVTKDILGRESRIERYMLEEIQLFKISKCQRNYKRFKISLLLPKKLPWGTLGEGRKLKKRYFQHFKQVGCLCRPIILLPLSDGWANPTAY